MKGIEERLERIERLLELVLRRLEKLEERAQGVEEEARTAAEMALAFSMPAIEAVRAARRLIGLFSSSRLPEDDGLTRSILEALITRGPLTLRGLEREVRRLRGAATRSLIRERVQRLEELGIIRVEKRGRRLVISLAEREVEGG